MYLHSKKTQITHALPAYDYVIGNAPSPWMYSHSKKTQLFKCNQFMVTSSTCSYIPTQTVAHLDTLWQVHIVQPYSHTRTTCKYFKQHRKPSLYLTACQRQTHDSSCHKYAQITVADRHICLRWHNTHKCEPDFEVGREISHTANSKTINSSQNNDKETVIFFGLY